MVKQAIRPAIVTWRQTEPELILCAVRWSLRDSLSFRDGDERLRARGLEADPTTIWRWVQHDGPELEERLRVISSPPRSPGVSMRPTFVSGAVGAPAPAPSIPLALRSTSCARGGALPRWPTACSARRCLIRRILGPASSTRTEHAATGRRLPA